MKTKSIFSIAFAILFFCSATTMLGSSDALSGKLLGNPERPELSQSKIKPEDVFSPSLIGYWETANINEPFNEDTPKLSLRLLADGELIADESTNRERRGTWELENGKIVEILSNTRYNNRILEFNKKEDSMVLKYEMYGNKPLRLFKVE